MKNTTTYSKYFKLAIITLGAALLASCGTSKSNPTTTTSTAYDFSSSKLLANCNKAKDSNFSINTSSVLSEGGQYSTEWMKMKFNFLSSTVTTSGNTIKFFKWRVVGTTVQSDSTPLTFAKYDLSSGSTVSSSVTSMSVSELSSAYGLYIQLNDANAQYQAIRAVIYNSSSQVVAQFSSLIPGFYASPTDYQYNSDGSARTITLQEMHPLYGTSITDLTQLQIQQMTDQYCF